MVYLSLAIISHMILGTRTHCQQQELGRVKMYHWGIPSKYAALVLHCPTKRFQP